MDVRRTATRIAAIAAMASLGSGAPALAAGVTLKLVERATSDAISVHGGAAADNTGDILTFANEVYDAGDKIKLGSDQGYCVRVIVGKAFECHWTVSLAKGQIAVDGPFLDAGDSTLAITGGTGAYSGARGDMRLHARDAKGGAYDFTYRLK